MKVEIQIHSDYEETKVVIYAKELSEEVHKIQEKLTEWTPQVLSGFYGDRLEIIDPGGNSPHLCPRRKSLFKNGRKKISASIKTV